MRVVGRSDGDEVDGGLGGGGPSSAATDGIHVVLDTDLAFDDVMALLYLLQRDDVVLDALTVEGTGEAHCDPGVRNAQALLALGGSPETPVACGRETPLEGTNTFPDEWRVASDDLSFLDLPEVTGEPDPRGAVGLLLDELEGDTTLITLGPWTNVAEALRSDGSLAERTPSVVAMAGQVEVPGNAPNGAAEYNVWVDPTAADGVLGTLDVTLVPLDATNQVPFTTYFADALAAAPSTPEADAVAAIIDANEEFYLSGGAYFWDPLAAVLALEPGLATWQEEPLAVATRLPGTEGQVYPDDAGHPTVHATAVPDPLGFEREYLSTLTASDVTTVRPEPTLTVGFDGERCVAPSTIPAGDHDVAFETTSPLSWSVLLRTDVGLSFDELMAVLGPQGAEVPRHAPELGEIVQIAEVQTMAPVTIDPGTIVAACAVLGDDPTSPPRIWIGEEITVTEAP